MKSLRSLFLCMLLLYPAVSHEYLNVYGKELESCSENGMALTGYTRNGHCVAFDGDSGSHHICINLNSTTGGNFCQVTGQPDWCSSQRMQCHDDRTKRNCGIHNWCVCQWAFARYIERAGGCSQIQEIVCESINMEALTSYQKDSRYETAYNCLVERCNLNPKDEESGNSGEGGHQSEL